MKVYIAARFSRRHEAHALGRRLQALGHTITSRWSLPDSDHVKPVGMSKQAADAERQRFAVEDIEDLQAADCCISFMQPPRDNSRGGRQVDPCTLIEAAARRDARGWRGLRWHGVERAASP